MHYLVLILLMIGFATAVEIDFDCPDEIFADEEFECSLEVTDGDGEYDVKIDLDGERDSALKAYNDGTWKSGYFYLKEFIEDGDERDIRLKISKKGDWDGVLKLRQGDKIEFFDIEIEVNKERMVEEENGSEEIVLSREEPEVVLLNPLIGDISEEIGELVYASKDARIVDWLPYGFSLFLIFVIGILLWERF